LNAIKLFYNQNYNKNAYKGCITHISITSTQETEGGGYEFKATQCDHDFKKERKKEKKNTSNELAQYKHFKG
jgi:hypothetical protein